MRIFKNLIIILLLSTSLSDCFKEEESHGGRIFSGLNEELFPLLFDVGSYWIYRDSATSRLDSTYVVNILPDTIAYSVGHGSAVYQESYMVWLNGTATLWPIETYRTYVISVHDYTSYLYLAGRQKGTTDANATIDDLCDSLAVEDVWYHGIVKMKIDKAEDIRYDMNLYYAPFVGIIRKEIKNDDGVVDIWNLIRYNVKNYHPSN